MFKKDMNDHSDQELKDSYAQNLSLLAINNCSYSKPVSSSNSSERIPIVNYVFNPQSYSAVSGSTVAQVVINSGAYSVYGPNSTVSLTVSFSDVVDTKLAWAWGDSFNAAYPDAAAYTSKSGGSCANIFRQATATSRGGTLCQQNLYANVYSAATLPFQGYGKEMLMSGAGAASFSADQWQTNVNNAPYLLGGFNFPVYSAACAVTFELPLSRIFHLFGQKAPLPAMFLSGMRLNLTFEQMQTAFVFFYAANAVTTGEPFQGPFVPVNPIDAKGRDGITVSGAVPNPKLAYNVSNMSLNLDVSQLWDSSTQILNHIASSLNSSGECLPVL